MRTIEIKHRWNRTVLYTTAVDDADLHPLHTALARALIAGRPAAELNARRAQAASAMAASGEADSDGARRRFEALDRELAAPSPAAVDLTGADLTGADLTGAYLTFANLTFANLAHANLTFANLAHANLAHAHLTHTNLTGADLTEAYLTYAYLADAHLTRTNLTFANLTGADLTGADLTDADLTDTDLPGAKNVPRPLVAKDPSESGGSRAKGEAARAARYRTRRPDVPVVPNLDGRILTLVEGGTGRLEMKDWHTCETTHCRAGWAIALAGEAGYELERRYGPAVAGGMIYRASVGRAPYFYASHAEALRDIRECAARDADAVLHFLPASQ